jgi:hypothetical protein
MRGDSNEVVVQGEVLGFGKKGGQQEQQLDHPGREGLDEGRESSSSTTTSRSREEE